MINSHRNHFSLRKKTPKYVKITYICFQICLTSLCLFQVWPGLLGAALPGVGSGDPGELLRARGALPGHVARWAGHGDAAAPPGMSLILKLNGFYLQSKAKTFALRLRTLLRHASRTPWPAAPHWWASKIEFRLCVEL